MRRKRATDAVALADPASRTAGESRPWFGFTIGTDVSPGVFTSRFAGPEQTVLVLGPPRSGKTSSIVIPSIWQAPSAVVSTSTKPDVLLATCTQRQEFGTCYVFDPTSSVALPEGVEELRWSPLIGCESFDASVSMAHALAGAGRPGAGMSEAAHWVERAEALLAPLFHAAVLGGKTMGDVCAWVLGHDVREAEAILSVTGAQMAKVTLSSVWRTEERERSGIFSTTAGLLSVYRSEAALTSASRPNFDPSRFAASDDTVYVCAPAYAQDQLAPLVVALLEQIRTACYLRRRRFPDSAPTLFVLDEVANIAPLPTLPQLASEGVSQGVVTLACLQDLSQARQRWGAVAEGFFSLFGTKLIFPGIADHATLELISALLGDEQVAMRSVSTPQAPHWGVEVLGALLKAPRRDHTPVVTHSAIFRRRMPVDEVYRGRPGHALLLSPTQWGYSGTAPWWALKDQPIVLGAGPPWQESAAKSSPWATPGSRVVPHDDPLERAPRIEVVPGQPPPPPVPPPVDEHGVGNAHHSGPASLVPALTGATVSGGPETPTRGALSSDRVMVRVLGPVEVVGWREAPSRRLVTELACFLALHDERNMSGEEVRAALWPGDLGATEVNAKSLRNTVSLLRKALGHDLVPEAQKGSGYKFAAGVLCDWTLFSDRVESATGPREIEELRAALSLVRGAPFEGVAPGSFTWAWTELFVSRMEVAIASAARRLGELALAQNDAELSTWAALQGLSATPYDHELWSMYLNASARSGRDALERSWKSARAVLGDGVRDLTPLFERLRGHQAQT